MAKTLINSLKPKSKGEKFIYAEESLTAAVQHVLHTLINAKGLKKKELAQELDLSPSTVSRILNESSNLTIRTIAKIFHVLEDEPFFTSRNYEKMVSEKEAKPSLNCKYIVQKDKSSSICPDLTMNEAIFTLSEDSSAAYSALYHFPQGVTALTSCHADKSEWEACSPRTGTTVAVKTSNTPENHGYFIRAGSADSLAAEITPLWGNRKFEKVTVGNS